ncbi:MAG: insulinase family protein [Myxococcota bacterium]
MVAWLVVGCTRAPLEIPAENPEFAAMLPVDSHVRQGTLPNGLKWFVEPNGEPAGRGVLRLAVRVGSVVEDEDQLGVAHFVEHMAFNGTTHYPGNSVIEWLESIGSEFGPHVNAHTSFDETVYKLQIPTDDPATLDKALGVLRDWADGLTFDPAEVEAERPVVLEEWRTRLGAQSRIDDATTPAIFFGSPYAVRRPIGTEASLRSFTRDAAVRFYRDWYRPDLMAVIAVGDFDPATIEARIAETFGSLAPPEKPRERVQFEIPDHADPKFVVVADPEVSRTAVQVLAKHDDLERATVGSYRDDLIEGVAMQIVNERMAERARAADAPFLGAGAGVQRLSPTEGAHVLGANSKPGQSVATYRELATQIRKAREQGFGQGELERAVARVTKQYESMLLEVDKTDSVTHASELLRVFTNGEAMPGTEFEVELARKYLPAITVADLDTWARGWMGSSRVVVVIEPANDAVASVEALGAVDAEVASLVMDAAVEEAPITPPVAPPAAPGAIASTDDRYREALGFTGWTLSNGVKVWWKDTDFQADEVVFQAFSPGGSSKVSDADAFSAAMMLAVGGQSGVGGSDATALGRWLAGKQLSVNPGLQESWDTFGGRSSVADLESALLVLHAMATAPRFDPAGFELALEQRRGAIVHRANEPMSKFADAWPRMVWTNDPRARQWTVEDLDQVKLERMPALYADRFGDAGDFTFVFAGALPDDFERLVTTWLATLPATGRVETPVDRGQRLTPGKLSEVVHSGVDPKAVVRIEWHGAFPNNDWDQRNLLQALADVLETLLRERVREQLGGTYGVSVIGTEERLPVSRYAVRVEFQCDPARADELVAAVNEVVAKLRDDGPPAEVVTQTQEKKRRGREQDLRENGFWVSAFAGALQRDADPLAILTFDARVASLSPAVIRAAAKTWLVDEQRAQLVLLPETP